MKIVAMGNIVDVGHKKDGIVIKILLPKGSISGKNLGELDILSGQKGDEDRVDVTIGAIAPQLPMNNEDDDA